MAEEIAPSREGWERLKEALHLKKSGSSHHPHHQVDVVIQYDDGHGSSTVEGTLISVKGSLEQDEEKREQHRYNGWFGKVRTEDGMVNIYADPDHSGPRIIFTDGWDGTGGRRYKWQIESIVIEEKPGTDPQCWACHSSMQFGYIRGWPDAPAPVSGWICTGCAAHLGRFKDVDIQRGLP